MKQEQKELLESKKSLLLKDLCARLPYGVNVNYKGDIYNVLGISHHRLVLCKPFMSHTLEYCPLVDEVKPYLFPLSSMTEAQKKEISKRYNYYNPYQSCVLITDHRQGSWDNDDNSCNLQDYLWLEDWFNKNQFDFRGLIPIGAAIDATGLNIY